MVDQCVLIDMMGREVILPKKRKFKVVSIVPSQTELIHELGIEVIGCTVFCKYPEEAFKNTEKIGGTKKLDIKKIMSLNPDIIIGNKEENEKSQIEELEKHFPVWMSDIVTLEDNLRMILELGFIFNVQGQANWINQQIRVGFGILRGRIFGENSCLYLIWNDPPMAAGLETFINEMLKEAGFNNLLEKVRYPEKSIEEIKSLKPEFLLLSSEPFPFTEKHVAFYQEQLPDTKVLLVNGEMFSWYGNRIIQAPSYFYDLFKTHNA